MEELESKENVTVCASVCSKTQMKEEGKKKQRDKNSEK